jgi:hypothetical protein
MSGRLDDALDGLSDVRASLAEQSRERTAALGLAGALLAILLVDLLLVAGGGGALLFPDGFVAALLSFLRPTTLLGVFVAASRSRPSS